jgi:hypothetical protein
VLAICLQALGSKEPDRDHIDADAGLFVIADVLVRIRTFLK